MQIRPFTCRRGVLTIRGTQFIPDKAVRRPIFIVSHEFMANRLFSLTYAKAAARLGYTSFCYDFCGGGIVSASGGRTTDMSVLTEVEDLKSVIAYAKSLPYTDERCIVLMGNSQGGLVSALTAAELQGDISALILQYPALSIPDDARKGHMIKASFDPENIPERLNCSVMRLGRRYVTDVIGLDAFEKISAYRGKVLLLHGDSDRLVDIDYSRRALSAYRESGADVRMEVIHGAGHIFLRPEHIRQAKRHITGFLAGL